MRTEIKQRWDAQTEMLSRGMGIAIREHGRWSVWDMFKRAWAWWNPPQTTASFQHGEW